MNADIFLPKDVNCTKMFETIYDKVLSKIDETKAAFDYEDWCRFSPTMEVLAARVFLDIEARSSADVTYVEDLVRSTPDINAGGIKLTFRPVVGVVVSLPVHIGILKDSETDPHASFPWNFRRSVPSVGALYTDLIDPLTAAFDPGLSIEAFLSALAAPFGDDFISMTRRYLTSANAVALRPEVTLLLDGAEPVLWDFSVSLLRDCRGTANGRCL